MITFNVYKLLLYAAGVMILFYLLLLAGGRNKLLWYVSIIGLLLNLVWEVVQMPLYAGYNTFADHLVCIPAAVGDVLVILFLYTIVSYVREDWYWIRKLNKRTIFLTTLLGILIAIIMEQRALMLGLWEYTRYMPLVPLVHVGLSPVLQMTLLPILTFFISNRMYRKLPIPPMSE